MKEPIKPKAPKAPKKPSAPDSTETVEIYRSPPDIEQIKENIDMLYYDEPKSYDELSEPEQLERLREYALEEKGKYYTPTDIKYYSKSVIEQMSSKELFDALNLPKEETNLNLQNILSLIPNGVSPADVTISADTCHVDRDYKINYFTISYEKPASKNLMTKYKKDLAEYEKELAEYKIVHGQYKKDMKKYKKDKERFDQYMADVVAKAKKGLIAI